MGTPRRAGPRYGLPAQHRRRWVSFGRRWWVNFQRRLTIIDDATGRLTALRFVPAETTRAYLETLRAHVLTHGVPLAFYSDRHGIFRVNAKVAESGDGRTEFGRAVERLDIEPIHASTPQAKGRVERANQTLQDRLVTEMRLRNICSMEQKSGQCLWPR